MANPESDYRNGLDMPSNFEMPTAREIEIDLALGSDSWQSLLPGDAPAGVQQPIVDPPTSVRRAVLRPADA